MHHYSEGDKESYKYKYNTHSVLLVILTLNLEDKAITTDTKEVTIAVITPRYQVSKPKYKNTTRAIR